MADAKGWLVVYAGIASVSIGTWINRGFAAALIVAGLLLVLAGLVQVGVAKND